MRTYVSVVLLGGDTGKCLAFAYALARVCKTSPLAIFNNCRDYSLKHANIMRLFIICDVQVPVTVRTAHTSSMPKVKCCHTPFFSVLLLHLFRRPIRRYKFGSVILIYFDILYETIRQMEGKPQSLCLCYLLMSNPHCETCVILIPGISVHKQDCECMFSISVNYQLYKLFKIKDVQIHSRSTLWRHTSWATSLPVIISYTPIIYGLVPVL